MSLLSSDRAVALAIAMAVGLAISAVPKLADDARCPTCSNRVVGGDLYCDVCGQRLGGVDE